MISPKFIERIVAAEMDIVVQGVMFAWARLVLGGPRPRRMIYPLN
jgi:hypothetical protein